MALSRLLVRLGFGFCVITVCVAQSRGGSSEETTNAAAAQRQNGRFFNGGRQSMFPGGDGSPSGGNDNQGQQGGTNDNPPDMISPGFPPPPPQYPFNSPPSQGYPDPPFPFPRRPDQNSNPFNYPRPAFNNLPPPPMMMFPGMMIQSNSDYDDSSKMSEIDNFIFILQGILSQLFGSEIERAHRIAHGNSNYYPGGSMGGYGRFGGGGGGVRVLVMAPVVPVVMATVRTKDEDEEDEDEDEDMEDEDYDDDGEDREDEEEEDDEDDDDDDSEDYRSGQSDDDASKSSSTDSEDEESDPETSDSDPSMLKPGIQLFHYGSNHKGVVVADKNSQKSNRKEAGKKGNDAAMSLLRNSKSSKTTPPPKKQTFSTTTKKAEKKPLSLMSGNVGGKSSDTCQSMDFSGGKSCCSGVPESFVARSAVGQCMYEAKGASKTFLQEYALNRVQKGNDSLSLADDATREALTQPMKLVECIFRKQGLLTSSNKIIYSKVYQSFSEQLKNDWKPIMKAAIANCSKSVPAFSPSEQLVPSDASSSLTQPLLLVQCVRKSLLLACPNSNSRGAACERNMQWLKQCDVFADNSKAVQLLKQKAMLTPTKMKHGG